VQIKIARFVPISFVFVLMLAVGVSLAASAPAAKTAASKSAASATTKTQTTSGKETVNNKETVNKKTTKTMAKSSANPSNHTLASAETLSGTISFVDPSAHEVTLVGSNGVSYDFKLNRKTQLELSNSKIAANQLDSEDHMPATVQFVPMSNGNLAENIQIKAS